MKYVVSGIEVNSQTIEHALIFTALEKFNWKNCGILEPLFLKMSNPVLNNYIVMNKTEDTVFLEVLEEGFQ